ncbi:MAG: endonuclease/exonuclease/phosphatase family protein [Bacteroidetes bacterium]|nr:endonuclease/exonuclease/phosphatase family protein [Bacteroidota bacterium]
MYIAYLVLAVFLIFATVIPFIQHQHWFFRGFDFGKVQFLVMKVFVFCLAFFFISPSPIFWFLQILLLLCIIYNAIILIRYTPIYKVKDVDIRDEHSDSVSILSANVYQFNKEYGRFIDLVNEVNPDIVLTMESNQAWGDAMKVLEKEYPYSCKLPLENTYGMHFYTKLKMEECQVHNFVADDIPSIEAELITKEGYKFTFFGVHPPPPSPTEEENSKERDGELLSIAKKVRKDAKTTLVVGDFNNVAWAKSSVLFRKTSETVDPRIGRGLISTFHARYWFMRFPLDQLYHTPDIFVQDLKVLPDFGSDHLPLFCNFYINRNDDAQEELVEELENGDMEEVNEMIEEGKEEQSERPQFAVERTSIFT